MADKNIELRHYPRADADALVFNRIWRLVDTGTSGPVTYQITEAYLDLTLDGRAKASFKLGSGLTWDANAKSVSVQIRNHDVAFIRDDAEMLYSFYVVWSHGAVQTLREGTVTAVRMA